MDSTFIVLVPVVLAQVWNYTHNVENGTTATIVCGMAGVTLPMWTGPAIMDTVGILTQYNYANSTAFNPALGQEKLSRLSWAANNRDLTLSPVTRHDAGTYQCFYNNQIWKISLVVRGMFFLVFFTYKINKL